MSNTIRQLFRLIFSKNIRPQLCRTFYYYLEGGSTGQVCAKDTDDAMSIVLQGLADRGMLPFGVVSTLTILDMENGILSEVTVTTPTFSLSLFKERRVKKVSKHD